MRNPKSDTNNAQFVNLMQADITIRHLQNAFDFCLRSSQFVANQVAQMPNLFSSKSRLTWAEGQACLAQGHINSAANRIYYSVFQAVKGAAIQRNKMTMDTTEDVHRLVLQIVGGESSRGMYFRRRLNQLMGLRIIADYKLEDVKEQSLKELLSDADTIRKYWIRITGGEI